MGTRDQIQDNLGIERLFKTYYQSLCFFSNQYVRNSHLAEDIVQSVFAKLAQNPPELDGFWQPRPNHR
ncbi:MAG: sigma factor [Bacteroidales bacterium]|nr:sigma factor [Bacteroidales bacterium]